MKIQRNLTTKLLRFVPMIILINYEIYICGEMGVWAWSVDYMGPMASIHMMTSSNWHIFRVAAPLCGEFTNHRWIPRTKVGESRRGRPLKCSIPRLDTKNDDDSFKMSFPILGFSHFKMAILNCSWAIISHCCQFFVRVQGHATLHLQKCKNIIQWRHQMETFSALRTLCGGNSPVTGEFPSQRPVLRSFYVFLSAPELTVE